jgi:hypothetical protein
MKKLLLSLAFLCGISFFGSAVQAQTYGIGTNVVNLGVGFGYSRSYYSGLYGSSSTTPVLNASFEHGMKELGPGTFGIGAAFSYQGSKWSYNDSYGDQYKETWKTMFFGIRGTWHPDFLVTDKYDVYGGVLIGYYHYGYTYTATGPYASQYNYSNPSNGAVGFGAFVGGRYYFTNSIGAFAEIGYDISYLKIGLSFKFGAAAEAK